VDFLIESVISVMLVTRRLLFAKKNHDYICGDKSGRTRIKNSTCLKIENFFENNLDIELVFQRSGKLYIKMN